MKTPPRHSEVEVAAAIHALFRRLPWLVGFSVQDADSLSSDRTAGLLERELMLADVEANPWPLHTQDLVDEITMALLDLIEQKPAVCEILRGRTFARALH